MDSTDFDRIQQIVDRAIEPLASSLKLMMPKDESLSRHTAAQERITSVDQRITQTQISVQEVVKWAMAEHEKLSKKNEEGLLMLNESIKEVNKQIDDVKTEISSGRATSLRYVVTVIVSIAIGIVIPILLKLLGV